jgi:hypothetical protein
MSTVRSVLPQVLGDACERLATWNNSEPVRRSVFRSSTVPSIAVGVYLTRLMRCLHDADIQSVLIVAMIYLERLVARQATLDRQTVHRLLASTVWASMKFLLDHHPSLLTYSRLAGVTEHEIIRMEVEIMRALDWKLGVAVPLFDCYKKSFLSICSFRYSEGFERKELRA